jgi:Tfp pilus assembly protein PilF
MHPVQTRILKALRDGLMIIVVTCLLLFVLELVLRAAGYGYPSSFLIRQQINGEDYYSNNIYYTSKFYTPELIRTPIPLRVKKTKDANTIRIAVAGESAALGDPDYSFGFSRILKIMLEDEYPDRKFEIINTAITAINSNVILPIVRETQKKLKPDVFLLYMGNNEVIGPYGPSSEFAGFRSSRPFIKFNIALNSTRVGQLVRNTGMALSKKAKREEWGGMEMFLNYKVKPGDEALTAVHSNFRANLHEIVGVVSRGSKLILSNVSVNLRNCPPFYSAGSMDLPGMPQDSAMQARVIVEKMLQEDPADAGVNYIYAGFLLNEGDAGRAKEYYELALRYDGLKFRADKDINDIIKAVYDLNRMNGRVSFIDMSDSLAKSSSHQIAGSDLFLEHVHFNFYGNYLMALNFNRKIRELLGPSTGSGPYPIEYYKERLAYTPYEDYKIYRDIQQRLDKAPFRDQINNRIFKDEIAGKIREIRKNVPDENVYVNAIRKDPDDWIIKYNYALFLIARGIYTDEVVNVLESVRKAVPQNPAVDFNIGFLFEQRGESDKALQHYLGALETFPFYQDARRNAAALMLAGGDEGFGRKFRKGRFKDADLVYICTKASKIHLAKGKKDAAMKVLATANQLDPADREAAQSLTSLLLEAKNYRAAIPVLSDYLAADSSDFDAHFKLGYCYEAEKSSRSALIQYLKANEAGPGNFMLLNKIGQLYFAVGEYRNAADFFEKSLMVGNNQKLEFTFTNLGSAYSKLGEPDRAIINYRKALELVPENKEIRKKLDEELLRK